MNGYTEETDKLKEFYEESETDFAKRFQKKFKKSSLDYVNDYGTAQNSREGTPVLKNPINPSMLSTNKISHSGEENSIDSRNGNDTNIQGQEVVFLQPGVARSEAIRKLWTNSYLRRAYISILILSFFTSLDAQTTNIFIPYATSDFSQHSTLVAVYVIQAILFAVSKSPIAKLSDVLGRFETLCWIVGLYSLGHLICAISNSLLVFLISQLFYSIGNTGLSVLIQIFIADTTKLLHRAKFTSLPYLPFLVTVWIGPSLAELTMKYFTWRYGYLFFTFFIPLSALPLFYFIYERMSYGRKNGLFPDYPWVGMGFSRKVTYICKEIDLFGTMLFLISFSLILIPLTLVNLASHTWTSPWVILPLFFGIILMVVCTKWESYASEATHSLFSIKSLKDRTMFGGCMVGLFDSMAYSFVQPYLLSYLMVSKHTQSDSAGRILAIFSFVSTIAAFLISFAIQHTGTYKIYLVLSLPFLVMGFFFLFEFGTTSVSLNKIVIGQMFIGGSIGIINLTAQLGIQATSSPQEIATMTALFLSLFSLGSAFGSAISGILWTTFLPRYLVELLPNNDIELANKIYKNMSFALSFEVGSDIRNAIDRSYDGVMNILVLSALITCIPCMIAAFSMKSIQLTNEDEEQIYEDIYDNELETSLV